MSTDQNILVKLNDAGLQLNNKWLVKGVSLQVEKGKIVTLIGPNGSGKSTTAKIALGIYKKIDGSVEKYTHKVGYVPQKISIDWTLPLRVNDFMVLTESLNKETIDEALSLTGVIHLKDKNLGDLSGGEFQRVLLAREWIGFIVATTLISAFAGTKIVKNDNIDRINGNFFMFFICCIFKLL